MINYFHSIFCLCLFNYFHLFFKFNRSCHIFFFRNIVGWLIEEMFFWKMPSNCYDGKSKREVHIVVTIFTTFYFVHKIYFHRMLTQLYLQCYKQKALTINENYCKYYNSLFIFVKYIYQYNKTYIFEVGCLPIWCTQVITLVSIMKNVEMYISANESVKT